jgi:hypothetical protein
MGIDQAFKSCRRNFCRTTLARPFLLLKKHGSAFQFPTKSARALFSIPQTKIALHKAERIFVCVEMEKRACARFVGN